MSEEIVAVPLLTTRPLLPRGQSVVSSEGEPVLGPRRQNSENWDSQISERQPLVRWERMLRVKSNAALAGELRWKRNNPTKKSQFVRVELLIVCSSN